MVKRCRFYMSCDKKAEHVVIHSHLGRINVCTPCKNFLEKHSLAKESK